MCGQTSSMAKNCAPTRKTATTFLPTATALPSPSGTSWTLHTVRNSAIGPSPGKDEDRESPGDPVDLLHSTHKTEDNGSFGRPGDLVTRRGSSRPKPRGESASPGGQRAC